MTLRRSWLNALGSSRQVARAAGVLCWIGPMCVLAQQQGTSQAVSGKQASATTQPSKDSSGKAGTTSPDRTGSSDRVGRGRKKSRFDQPIRMRGSEVIAGPGQSNGPTLMPQRIKLEALTGDTPDVDIIQKEIPDPRREKELVAEARKKSKKKRDIEYYDSIEKHISQIKRDKVLELSLHDAIHRALRNNFRIRAQGYGPAMDATRIVEAQAAFDETFFLNMTSDKQDRPSPSQLSGTSRQDFLLTGGIRKLLPTGMQVETSLSWTRTETNLSFQTLNPAHFTQFVVQLRQPLLRGFGLDFNRSQINVAKVDRNISEQTFVRQVRDVLFDVEQAYWQLSQARVNVTITARLLASFKQIYDYYVRRGEYDAYPVQINLTKTRLEAFRAEFIQVKQRVQDAEDRLKGLMNDPDVNLSMDIEIIPTDLPIQDGVLLDPLSEVQAALENRTELREARFNVERAQILRGVAKNQLLPRFDLVFRYAVDGLGGNADQAFDEVTRNNFNEYLVTVEFEYPLGNRAAEAAFRRARLQEAQAQAALRTTIEEIIRDVNFNVRDVRTNYDQIAPALASAVAAAADVKARIERQERRDPLTLESELNARQSLRAARVNLLNSLVNYAISIANLERGKGTLLQYNNVVIDEAE